MYADRVVAGAKRSISERLSGDVDLGRFRSNGGKRQRQIDEKWKHDLYKDDEYSRASESRVGPRDLRLKLQKREMQQGLKGGMNFGVRDLREKLSGIVQAQPQPQPQPQPKKLELQKVKAVGEKGKDIRKSAPAEAPLSETKKPSEADSSRKKPQQKAGSSSVDSLLRSLGLEKYSITFQAEEIDMAAIKHMGDEDLKALGIPMGPRKKILLALKQKSQA